MRKHGIRYIMKALPVLPAAFCMGMICGGNDYENWMQIHFEVMAVGPGVDSSAFAFMIRLPDGSTRVSRCVNCWQIGYESVVLHTSEERAMHGGDVFISAGYPSGDSLLIAPLDTLSVGTISVNNILSMYAAGGCEAEEAPDRYCKRILMDFGLRQDTVNYDVTIGPSR